MPLPRTLRERFYQNGLDWVDRSYGIDWLVVIGLWLLTWAVSNAPVFERNFDLKDPLISHPLGKDQISSAMNFILSMWIPAMTVAIAGFLNGSLMEIHHGIMALCAGQGLTDLITVLGKHVIGRLRPDFLARCSWDEVIRKCTGNPGVILSGRKAFPSGHSSTAFSGMMFLALWLAGKTGAWSLSMQMPSRLLRSSRMANFLLTLLPLFWASFVAMSRLQDYRHHKEDVIVGSLIGIVCATLCYLLFWPSPFIARSFEGDRFGQPRMLYVFPDPSSRPSVEFQLARLEDETVVV